MSANISFHSKKRMYSTTGGARFSSDRVRASRGGRSDEVETYASCGLLARGCRATLATAQDAETEKAIEKYRQMLKEDPWSNPGLLDADRGEALWTTARGPKNVSLEQCDLGKGAGMVDGAFAELPRYFADADQVMDLETRILWCMEKLQGFNRADLVKRPHPAGGQPVKELGAIATYVANKSQRPEIQRQGSIIPRRRTRSRSARRCSSAAPARSISPASPATAKGLRIRLQGLPLLSAVEEARKVIGEWPAYRVSTTHVMTMQHRLYDCFWQMRMPELELGSDVERCADRLPCEDRPRAARSPPPGSSAESSAMRTLGIGIMFAALTQRAGSAQQQPTTSIRRGSTPRSSRPFRSCRPEWQARLLPDETMRQCSAHRNSPPRAVAEAIQQRDENVDYRTILRRRQGLIGDWKKGEAIAQSGYGHALHRLSAAPAPTAATATPVISSPRKRSATARSGRRSARIRQAAQFQRRPTPRRPTRRSTTRTRRFRAPTCRASARTRS